MHHTSVEQTVRYSFAKSQALLSAVIAQPMDGSITPTFAADEVGGNLLGGAGEEGLGEGWVVLRERGGYWSGLGGQPI